LININTFNLLETHQDLSAQHMGKQDGSAHDLERVEAKLNLLIQLVNQLLQSNQPVPEPQTVHLSAQGMHWYSATALESGTLLRLHLYLAAEIAQPIRLCARVTDFTDKHVRVVFLDLDEKEEDMLAKWIFRIHRRGIALARQH